MKQMIYFAGALALLLTACAPQLSIETNVQPTLFSATVREGSILLQGRYFGDGQDGRAENSFVLLGADATGRGGVRVRPSRWSPSRIELNIPEGVGYGYVYVVVNGVRSNGLPLNLR